MSFPRHIKSLPEYLTSTYLLCAKISVFFYDPPILYFHCQSIADQDHIVSHVFAINIDKSNIWILFCPFSFIYSYTINLFDCISHRFINHLTKKHIQANKIQLQKILANIFTIGSSPTLKHLT